MPPTTYPFSAKSHSHLIPYLAALHGTCITHDHLIDAFLPPLNHEKLLTWWKSKIADDRLVIILLLDESEPGTRAKGPELVGAALLRIPESETSPFRASVESILVSLRYRRRGAATMLLEALQAQAIVMGKTVLTAGAEADSVGDVVMRKFGFREVGRIPNYALSPADNSKRDQTILYKELISS